MKNITKGLYKATIEGYKFKYFTTHIFERKKKIHVKLSTKQAVQHVASPSNSIQSSNLCLQYSLRGPKILDCLTFSMAV